LICNHRAFYIMIKLDGLRQGSGIMAALREGAS